MPFFHWHHVMTLGNIDIHDKNKHYVFNLVYTARPAPNKLVMLIKKKRNDLFSLSPEWRCYWNSNIFCQLESHLLLVCQLNCFIQCLYFCEFIFSKPKYIIFHFLQCYISHTGPSGANLYKCTNKNLLSTFSILKFLIVMSSLNCK